MDNYPRIRKCLVVVFIVLCTALACNPIINANNPKADTRTHIICKSNVILDNGTLSGHVIDIWKNPIEGAMVRVYFHDTYRENYSDSAGYFHVTDIPICFCMKNATCSKQGYYSEWELLSISENTTHDFVLIPNNWTRLAIVSLSPFIVKNIGNITAFNVSWSIIVKGGFIVIGRSSSGMISGPLEPGQEIILKSGKMILLGFGSIEIIWSVWADNAPMVSANFTGRLLFTLLLP